MDPELLETSRDEFALTMLIPPSEHSITQSLREV